MRNFFNKFIIIAIMLFVGVAIAGCNSDKSSINYSLAVETQLEGSHIELVTVGTRYEGVGTKHYFNSTKNATEEHKIESIYENCALFIKVKLEEGYKFSSIERGVLVNGESIEYRTKTSENEYEYVFRILSDVTITLGEVVLA